jgi:predicted dehydrogenase
MLDAGTLGAVHCIYVMCVLSAAVCFLSPHVPTVVRVRCAIAPRAGKPSRDDHHSRHSTNPPRRYNIFHPEDVCARLPGVVRQIGTHHAYTVLYLLGADPPREVSAFRSTLRDHSTGVADDRENLATITFTTASGAIVHLQFNFASDDHSSDAWSFYVKVGAARGRRQPCTRPRAPILTPPAPASVGRRQVIGSKGSTRYSYNDWVHNAKTMVHSHTYEPYPHTIAATDTHFVERVVGRGEPPLSTLDHAVMAQKILDAAEVSWTERRHVAID